MKYTTTILYRATWRVLPRRTHLLVVLCLLTLAILGRPPAVFLGWAVLPPVTYALGPYRPSSRPRGCSRGYGAQTWQYLRGSSRVPLVRSMTLAALWLASGRMGPWAVIGWPWVVWGWQAAGILCPGLARQPEWQGLRWTARWMERVLLVGYIGLALRTAMVWHAAPTTNPSLSPLSLLGVGAVVQLEHDPDEGRYQVELNGLFRLAMADDDPFRLRLLVLFLRLLDDPHEQRGSRRTRDGRTPCVRQQYLADVLDIPHPLISRWERYWLVGDWRRLLSQRTPEILTLERQQQIIETWAHWPQWGIDQVHRLLVDQGVPVTRSQVRQAAHESGWQVVRRVLGRLCVQQAEELRLRDDWLLSSLLGQIEMLVGKLETGEGLTPEEQLDLGAWQAALDTAGLQADPRGENAPWLRRVEQVLLRPATTSGQPDEGTLEGVCCPQCGSDHVGRKGRKSRWKKVIDEQGQVQEVALYRYRCHNRQCPRESFSVYPPGVVPYSRQRLEVHVLALQMYAWGYSTYRRTGQALGVAGMTAYRWVSAFGHQLLPVAALFGVVRSSGVVGVDEKWVQVPKNAKPGGEHRKWMYVYLAVDVYTYDLLHIAIYAHNTRESAHAFLLALRVKGYHPRVVVTDLRRDYAAVISKVFPQAQHHECLFHAMQALHRQLAQVYGWDELRHNERLIALRHALDGPLQARTKRTAQRRYDRLMAQREAWIAEQPELAGVFGTLEGHWPKLINGIESDLIPRTNNTVELVIRRFDQHYQNFCGFDSLETAARYLAVFEKVYRFTPFSTDAKPGIRGQSPLQLAGYDVHNLPLSAACNGWAIILPIQPSQEGVPNG
jgi:transposase-like protein